MWMFWMGLLVPLAGIPVGLTLAWFINRRQR